MGLEALLLSETAVWPVLNLAVIFILCGLPSMGARLSLGGPCGASSLKATRGCWVGTQGEGSEGAWAEPKSFKLQGGSKRAAFPFPTLVWGSLVRGLVIWVHTSQTAPHRPLGGRLRDPQIRLPKCNPS